MDLLILFLQIFGVILSLTLAWFFFHHAMWSLFTQIFQSDITKATVGGMGLLASVTFSSLAVWQTVAYGWIVL